jgi:hypothetical protein
MITDLQASALASQSALTAFRGHLRARHRADVRLRIRLRIWLCPPLDRDVGPLRLFLAEQAGGPRVGRAMVAAVPVERGWHLVIGGRRVRHCLVNLDTNENEETPSD